MIYAYFTLFLTRITECIFDHAFTLIRTLKIKTDNFKFKTYINQYPIAYVNYKY